MSNVDLANVRTVIMVFTLQGCGACEEYLPRLQRAAQAMLRQGLMVLVYDAADTRPDVQALMDQYEINATPTTLLLVRGPGSLKFEGSITDQQIAQVLATAATARGA